MQTENTLRRGVYACIGAIKFVRHTSLPLLLPYCFDRAGAARGLINIEFLLYLLFVDYDVCGALFDALTGSNSALITNTL